MQVFISYRRNDTAFAPHALRYALKLGGRTVFLDTGAIRDGVAWRVVSSYVARSGVTLRNELPR